MSYADGVPPPTLCRWWLRIAGRLAPPALRQEWRKCWYSRLVNLCILVERGEVAGRDRAELMLLCTDAMSNAFWLRFNRAGLRYWAQGPQFVMTMAVAGGLLLALLSRGFQATRSIVDAAIEWNIEPRQLRYDPRGDLVVGHVVPLVLALAIGAALVAIGRLSLGRPMTRRRAQRQMVEVLLFGENGVQFETLAPIPRSGSPPILEQDALRARSPG